MRRFRVLAWSSWLEMIRNPLVVVMSMVFPLCFLALFAFLPDLPLPNGSEVPAFTFGLPAVLLFAMLTLGMIGTATPIVEQRKDGVLRSIGMTPVTRLEFVVAQTPGRVLVQVAEFLLIGLIAAATGSLDIASPGVLVLAVLLSMVCTISLGLLMGATTSNASLVGGLGGLLAPLLLMLSGVMIPVTIFPQAVAVIGRVLPFTYLGDMLRHSLVGLPLDYPLPLSIGVCLGYGLVMTLLVLPVFRWDSRPKKAA